MERMNKRTKDLCQALIEAGICNSDNPRSPRVTIHRWIKDGLFIYPQNRKHRRHYMYSQRMIDDIVKAFGPNGSRKWSIEDYNV